MLDRFGFTPTEMKSYQALLKLGRSTGYGVARELGIARANVYQALESLVRRGAARKAATIPSQYVAAQPAALIAELEREFRRDLVSLDESLRRLPQTHAADQTLEILDTTDRLFARASEIVEGAGTEVLAVTGPWAPDLAAALERASGRGVSVRAVSLGAPAPAPAVVRQVGDAELRSYWGGLPIAVVVDRARAVFGVLTSEAAASGLMTSAPGAVPFLRHLLRRELSAGA